MRCFCQTKVGSLSSCERIHLKQQWDALDRITELYYIMIKYSPNFKSWIVTVLQQCYTRHCHTCQVNLMFVAKKRGGGWVTRNCNMQDSHWIHYRFKLLSAAMQVNPRTNEIADYSLTDYMNFQGGWYTNSAIIESIQYQALLPYKEKSSNEKKANIDSNN